MWPIWVGDKKERIHNWWPKEENLFSITAKVILPTASCDLLEEEHTPLKRIINEYSKERLKGAVHQYCLLE